MGSFSWCYCDTGEVKIDSFGCPRPTKWQRLVAYDLRYPASVLFPKEFGGKDAQINVERYEDYGRFGDEDIYCLVADWNREWVSKHPDFKMPQSVEYERKHPEYPAKKLSEYEWWPFYSDLSLSRNEVVRKWKEAYPDKGCLEYRTIGIDIACYDEDNAALPYPVKIARDPDSVYEKCPPSISDPNQGFSDSM